MSILSQSDHACQTESRSSPEKPLNVLLTSFAGLGLPRTLSLQTTPTAPISDVVNSIHARLPQTYHSFVISTTSNKQLLPSNPSPISTLLAHENDTFIPLRLSAKLCGGKGGFGSQLRAAGGRMSSRKRANQQNVNGSNRNLDGRRLRTVDEAKRLAEYLAIKPEMDRKEKEERKKRWEAVVEAADKREADIRSGKVGANQGRLDAGYVEEKELAEEKTREAVLRAVREGMVERTGSETDSEDVGEGESEEESEEGVEAGPSAGGKQLFGWDEDEDDEEDDEEEEEEAPRPAPVGKGKAKAKE